MARMLRAKSCKKAVVKRKGRKCAAEGCSGRPSFNIPTKTTGKFCAEHKTEGMIDVRGWFYVAPEHQSSFLIQHRNCGLITLVRDSELIFCLN